MAVGPMFEVLDFLVLDDLANFTCVGSPTLAHELGSLLQNGFRRDGDTLRLRAKHVEVNVDPIVMDPPGGTRGAGAGIEEGKPGERNRARLRVVSLHKILERLDSASVETLSLYGSGDWLLHAIRKAGRPLQELVGSLQFFRIEETRPASTDLHTGWNNVVKGLMQDLATTRAKDASVKIATPLCFDVRQALTYAVGNSNLVTLDICFRDSSFVVQKLHGLGWGFKRPEPDRFIMSRDPPLLRLDAFERHSQQLLIRDDSRVGHLERQRLADRPRMVVISHTVLPLAQLPSRFARTGIMQHLVIARSGFVEQYVPLGHRAWHAGLSFYGAVGGHAPSNDVNSHAIGIALEGNGCDEDFTPEQYHSLRNVLSQLRSMYGIQGRHVHALADVAYPPGRHVAPGQHFQWCLLDNFDETYLPDSRVQHIMQELPVLRFPDVVAENAALEHAAHIVHFFEGLSVGESREHHITRLQLLAQRYLGQEISDLATLYNLALALKRCREEG